MNYYVRLGLVLLAITAIASGVLAFLNGVTEPIIKANKVKAEIAARKEVLPDAVSFVADSVQVEAKATTPDPLAIKEEVSTGASYFKFFQALNEAEETVGYCFTASLYGYSGDVKTMVGIGNDMKINKIKVISQTETPGLGANCIMQSFQDRFNALGSSELVVDKDGGNIQSLTGATITTRTIANSIKDGLEVLEKAMASDSAIPEGV